jgi:hypothetical protein
MFGVGGEVATLVSVYGIQFVHLVFGEADRAELRDAQAESEYDEEGERGDNGPIERTGEAQAANSGNVKRRCRGI